MKNSNFLIFLFFLVAISSTKIIPQEFQWADVMHPYATGSTVISDKDGNSYVAGEFHDSTTFGDTTLVAFGWHNIFVVKYDISGNMLWVKQIPGSDLSAQGISIDLIGNIYLTGSFTGNIDLGTTIFTTRGINDIFLAKMDPQGNCIWAKQAGGRSSDNPSGISLDSDGDIYITGSFYDTLFIGTMNLISRGSSDIFIAKYNNSGNLLWAKQAGGLRSDFCLGIDVSSDKEIYITGSFFDTTSFGAITLISNGGRDTYLAKLDHQGNYLWAQRAGGALDEHGMSVCIDSVENSYIVGTFKGTTTFGTTTLISYGDWDIFLAKYDNVGNCIWAKQAGGTSFEGAHKVNLDRKGNIYITGSFQGTTLFGTITLQSYGLSDIFLSKYDNVGNCIWAKQAGGNYSEWSYAVCISENDCVTITGTTNSNTSFGNINLTDPGCFVAQLREKFALLSSPKGGEEWQANSMQTIAWTSSQISNLKIEYTTNNGIEWVEIVASIPALNGSYSWIIPNTPSNQCKVRLMAIDDNSIFSISHSFFTITPIPLSAKISADSVWLDPDYDGLVIKQVSGSQSVGNITSYEWFVKNVKIAQGINPNISFGTGDNWLKLKVTDNLNQIAYDSVRIKVYCSKSKTNGGIYSGVSQIGNQFYVTSLDKGVYRFDSTGVLPPAYLTGGSIQSTMAISNKSLLYVGSDDTRLYCFDVNLSSIWDKSTGGIIKASPSITSDGNTIYIGTSNGYLKALDANNGNSKWTFIANGGIISSPTIVEVIDSNQIVTDKIIYFGTDQGMFYAIKDKETTFENYWSINTTPDSAIISSPAISGDGMLYFGSKNGNLYRVKWDGIYQPDWNKNTGGKISSSPVIGKNDIVYVANSNGYIYGYEKEFTSGSSPLKQFNIQSGVNGTPSIGADGNLYLGFNNGKFYKLEDTDGVTDLAIKWYLSANGGIEGPVLATENGIIVVGCTNGDIYIMKDPVTNTEGVGKLNLSWPTFKGNNKRNKVTRIGNFPTAVKDITELPTEYYLSQNYPNPFNPSTVINYQLPENSHVTLKVFDMIGNEVATLVNEEKPVGYHTVTFNAENISTGVYFYQMKAGEFVSTKKLLLVK